MMDGQRNRSLVVHGHFYQPPRENPWTERIDRQESASPYHDWNERIASECYIPNGHSRRLDGYGRISRIINNYEWISFNFGPTLLSWIENNSPGLYERILEADRASAARLGGHGNALAQIYNHIIMPLANRRDQETQIHWCIRDFETRFSRSPEGIWLSETAINEQTLEILTASPFRFTILSPRQALRIRPLDRSSGWKNVSDGSIPTGFPYRCFSRGASGRRRRRSYIDIFFYDAGLAQDISFNHLLRNGDNFIAAISDAYERCGNDLVVVASDGEIYGHHEPFADMALSYLIDRSLADGTFKMTNFGAYLDDNEPVWEVQLKPGPDGEGTAWSCSHGVGHWKEDCGCSVAAPAGWNQKWRAPLRRGFDKLRDALTRLYEIECGSLLSDPWMARNDYIAMIEDGLRRQADRFIAERARRPLSPSELCKVLSLLESQRYALFMYTSCGWFFNDISGIETVQCMLYAARAIELAGYGDRERLEALLTDELAEAESNLPDSGNGRDTYMNSVRRFSVGKLLLTGQHAINSYLFGPGEASEIFKHRFNPLDEFERGFTECTLRAGSVEVTSILTLDSSVFNYVLIVGEQFGVTCLVKRDEGEGDYSSVKKRISAIPDDADLDGIIMACVERFGSQNVSLRDLFPEDRERIIARLADRKIKALEKSFSDLYEGNRNLLRMLKEASLTPPASLLMPAQAHLTAKLVREVEEWECSLDPAGLDGIRKIIDESDLHGVTIDRTSAAESFSQLILENIRQIGENRDVETIRGLLKFIEVSDELGIEISQNDIQNEIFPILRETAPSSDAGAGPELENADEFARVFSEIAARFNFNTDMWQERLP